MQTRCQRLLLAGLVLLGATVGIVTQALTQAITFTEFSIPTANSTPFGITAGPDGNLWFAEQSAARIGRITTAGIFDEYGTPTAYSEPIGIVAGSDGALWFTEFNVGKIGRITTNGAVTEFPAGLTSQP